MSETYLDHLIQSDLLILRHGTQVLGQAGSQPVCLECEILVGRGSAWDSFPLVVRSERIGLSRVGRYGTPRRRAWVLMHLADLSIPKEEDVPQVRVVFLELLYTATSVAVAVWRLFGARYDVVEDDVIIHHTDSNGTRWASVKLWWLCWSAGRAAV